MFKLVSRTSVPTCNRQPRVICFFLKEILKKIKNQMHSDIFRGRAKRTVILNGYSKDASRERSIYFTLPVAF